MKRFSFFEVMSPHLPLPVGLLPLPLQESFIQLIATKKCFLFLKEIYLWWWKQASSKIMFITKFLINLTNINMKSFDSDTSYSKISSTFKCRQIGSYLVIVCTSCCFSRRKACLQTLMVDINNSWFIYFLLLTYNCLIPVGRLLQVYFLLFSQLKSLKYIIKFFFLKVVTVNESQWNKCEPIISNILYRIIYWRNIWYIWAERFHGLNAYTRDQL